MPVSPLIPYLDTTDEVEVITRKVDGDERGTVIWSMVVDGVPYLRSVEGAAGLWYRRAVARGWVAFAVDGRRHEADIEPIDDAEVATAVDEAIRTKYAHEPDSVELMLREPARAATLRLHPRG